jgi:alanine or glycine:cation symporter, AGCS family
MLQRFFFLIDLIGDWLWAVPALLLLIGVGFVLSFRSRWVQVRRFPSIVKIFFGFMGKDRDGLGSAGVHPLQAFFASVGGAIGLGNVVVICTAVQLGGPGALFWVWVTALVGMVLKYGEIYLGMIYRQRNNAGSYDGGPMYFLRHAFRARWIPPLVSLLLCVYGVEVFMFSAMTETVVINWGVNRYAAMALFLILVFLVSLGGVKRVGEVSSAIIPIFVGLYLIMALWVLVLNVGAIPEMFATIFKSAFTGHAPVGAFAGSGLWMAATQGAARGCYSGDIGIGYASVIHSESSTLHPAKQAGLAVFGIFLDTFVVCTMSIFIILVTGVWSSELPALQLVQSALSESFPFMRFFMPLLLCLLGFSTITAYFTVGLKCAKFLSPRRGPAIYALYAVAAFILFSFLDPLYALGVMTLAGALLLLINLTGIFVLRDHVKYDIPPLKEC